MRLTVTKHHSYYLGWLLKICGGIGLVMLLVPACWGQLPQAGDTTSPPTPGVGHDYIHSPAETVNPANGSVSIRIPIRIPEGRELTIPLSIAYDSSGGFYIGQGSNAPTLAVGTAPFSLGGWSYTFPMLTYHEGKWTDEAATGRDKTCLEGINYVFQDPTGNRHNLNLTSVATPVGAGCGGGDDTGGEGPILAATSDYSGDSCCSPVQVTDGNGAAYL